MSKKHGKNKGKGVRSGNSTQPPSRPSSGPASARESQPESSGSVASSRESDPQPARPSTPTMRPSMASVKPGIGFVFDVPSAPRAEEKKESASPVTRDSSDASEAIAEALSKDEEPSADSDAKSESKESAQEELSAKEEPSAKEEAKHEKEQAKSETAGQKEESKEIEPAAKPANKDKTEQPGSESKLKAKKASQEQLRETKSEGKGLHDDVHDEFFRKGEEVEKEHIAAHSKSLPPSQVEFHFDDDHAHKPRVLTPEMISHKKRLRRIVTYVLGASIVLAAGAAVKLMSGPGPTTIDEKSAMAALPTPKTDPEPVKPAPVQTAILAPSAAPVASIEPMASAEAVPSAAPAASIAIPDGVDPKKEALRLLERSKFKEAIPMAEAAIAKDPTDAFGYLYLGTALQSSGKWKEGIAAYSRCVHAATKGPVVECRQSGGR